MRNPVENISLLQKQINDLQLENQILKNILDRSGISYVHEIARISESEKAEWKWQIYFMQDSGDDRMFMRGEARKKGRERPVIIRNAIIAGKISVLKWVIRK